MQPDERSVSVVIACSGSAETVTAVSKFGTMRRRGDDFLEYAQADGQVWHERFIDARSAVGLDELLVEPSVADVEAVLQEARDRLIHSSGVRGRLNLVFAGHADATGQMELRDGSCTLRELLDIFLADAPRGWRPQVALVLDCCHAALPLAQAMTHRRNSDAFVIVDAFAACMPDEDAWELDSLRHGALTYAMTGHRQPTAVELASAVRNGDDETLARALHFAVPNPVTLLTGGLQNSCEVTNNHLVEVRGAGSFDLTEPLSEQQFLDSLEIARVSTTEACGGYVYRGG